MIEPRPSTLEGHGVRLEPLTMAHHDGLEAAAADGKLWELWYTSVPDPGKTRAYIETALAGQEARHMLPWAVRDLASGAIVGSTRYHDVVPAADRVEIGWTWYAKRVQRSHVNTACKLLLLAYALFYQRDSVFIFAYLFTWIPYIRNLVIHHRHASAHLNCPKCEALCAPRSNFCSGCGARLVSHSSTGED